MRDMENKIYTEDDLHNLIGNAIAVIEESIGSPNREIRFLAAVQFLQLPVTSAVIRAQETKMTFPSELDSTGKTQ